MNFVRRNDGVGNPANALLNSTVISGICSIDDIAVKSEQKHHRPGPMMASVSKTGRNQLSPMRG